MKKISKKSLIQFQTGAALLEAIVALSAVVVAVAGIAVVITASISNSQFVQDQNRANKYAQEGMEYLKSEKENNYSQFITKYNGKNHCFNDEFEMLIPYDGNCGGNNRLGNGKFIRTIKMAESNICKTNLSNPLEKAYRAEVTVYWQSSKCDVSTNSFCHSSELTTCFAQTAFSNMSLD